MVGKAGKDVALPAALPPGFFDEGFGPLRHVGLDLLIQPAEQFTERALEYDFAGEGRFKGRVSDKPLVSANLGSIRNAHEKGHLRL